MHRPGDVPRFRRGALGQRRVLAGKSEGDAHRSAGWQICPRTRVRRCHPRRRAGAVAGERRVRPGRGALRVRGTAGVAHGKGRGPEDVGRHTGGRGPEGDGHPADAGLAVVPRRRQQAAWYPARHGDVEDGQGRGQAAPGHGAPPAGSRPGVSAVGGMRDGGRGGVGPAGGHAWPLVADADVLRPLLAHAAPGSGRRGPPVCRHGRGVPSRVPGGGGRVVGVGAGGGEVGRVVVHLGV